VTIMAWQSASPIPMGTGNGGGNGGDGGNQVNQPQGTEYTLQGMGAIVDFGVVFERANMANRGNALSPNRMAPARTRSQCLGD
jgi:hypothetical protein